MDASNTANALSETHAIAPTGDIILVVGGGKTELRVHSVCMRTASKVFDAMLGPRFLEGQPSNGVLPRKISMPDDNAAAMTTICNVIHHRNDLAPDVRALGGLAEIALAADKYDCVLALKYAMFQWLNYKVPVTFLNLGRLLIAAYVFNNSDAFRRVTQRLITDFSLSYLLLIDTKFAEIIPSAIYCKFIPFFCELLLLLNVLPDSLEEARTSTRVSVQDVLLPVVAPCCDRSSPKLYRKIKVLLDNNLWGPSLFNVPIDYVVAKAGGLVDITSLDEDERSCPHTRNNQQSKETRYSMLQELTASAGLCLACARLGNHDTSLPCELDH